MSARATPSRRATGLVAAPALVVVLLSSFVALAGLVATVGATLVIVGTIRGSRRTVAVGTAVEFVALVVAGIFALDLGVLLVATVAVVLSWDLAEQAITAAAQLETPAASRQPLVAHAAGSTLAGVVVVGIVYSGYLFAVGQRPVLAVVLLLAGGSLVFSALRL